MMSRRERITRIVEALRRCPPMLNVFNPWRDSLETRRVLAEHLDRDAKYLLIGEAAGFKGCRISGIPFTSEHQLVEGRIPGVLCRGRLSDGPRPSREASATMVWEALYALGIERDTVLWNAFPFHPHRPGEPLTNRPPTKNELSFGREYLAAICALYGAVTIVAVGNHARRALESLEGSASNARLVVRHPANGGAPAFRKGLRGIVAAS